MCAYKSKYHISIINFFVKSTYVTSNINAIQACIFSCKHMKMKLWVIGVMKPETLTFLNCSLIFGFSLEYCFINFFVYSIFMFWLIKNTVQKVFCFSYCVWPISITFSYLRPHLFYNFSHFWGNWL